MSNGPPYFTRINRLLNWVVPNVGEADDAKAFLSVPDSDHLTLLNVYNNYIQSTMSPRLFHFFYDSSVRHSYQKLDQGQLSI